MSSKSYVALTSAVLDLYMLFPVSKCRCELHSGTTNVLVRFYAVTALNRVTVSGHWGIKVKGEYFYLLLIEDVDLEDVIYMSEVEELY